MTGKDRDGTKTSDTHLRGGRFNMKKKLISPNHLEAMSYANLRTLSHFLNQKRLRYGYDARHILNKKATQ